MQSTAKKSKGQTVISYLLLGMTFLRFNPLAVAAGSVVSAASCQQADVRAAVNAASDGSTVRVPAGHCTWTTPALNQAVITLTRSLTLQGAGVDQTVIDDQTGTGSGEDLVNVGPNCRVTGFTFSDARSVDDFKPAITAGGTNWRVDHNRFVSNGTKSPISAYESGLIDQNIFENTQHIGIYGAGDASWTQTVPLGSGNVVYIERNIFKYPQMNDGAVDAFDGARYVFRFNSVYGTQLGNHGFDSGPYRGTMQFEIYNNYFENDGPTSVFCAMNFRSGSGVIFNNVVSPTGGSYADFGKLQNFRSSDGYLNDSSNNTHTVCDGTSSFDGNSQPISSNYGYPCRDQIGRGTNQQSQPLLSWNNTFKNSTNRGLTVDNAYGGIRASTYHILPGRDFFDLSASPSTYSPYACPHPLAQSTVACDFKTAGAPLNLARTAVAHPADSNADFVITSNEATVLAACWKDPRTAGNCPSTIDINTAVRAGTLWKGNALGAYHYDSGFACPLCWQSGF